MRGSIAAANKSQIPLTPRAAPRMEDESTSLRAARTSTPRKISWARIAGRQRPIWSARELVSQFPTYGRALSPGESRRSEEHTSELQSRLHLVCRLLLEKKKQKDEEEHRG